MANINKQRLRKYHIIYKTTNSVNGKIYIGAHSTDDLDDDYFGSGFRLRLAIERYGKECFSRVILYQFNTPQEMFAKEREIVNAEFLKRTDVYNIVEGGFGGFNKGTTGLKHLHHPETNARCAVHPNVILSMLQEGWKVGRNMSSTTDKIWISKGFEKKMVLPSDLKKYLASGWSKGLPKSPTAGKVWIYHADLKEYSLIDPKDFPKMLSLGWTKKKWAPIKKGTSWINNGVNNLRINASELDSYLSLNWKKGMLTSRWKQR